MGASVCPVHPSPRHCLPAPSRERGRAGDVRGTCEGQAEPYGHRQSPLCPAFAEGTGKAGDSLLPASQCDMGGGAQVSGTGNKVVPLGGYPEATMDMDLSPMSPTVDF